jgi:secondary thiamine-phosphate synthase enzyme
LGNLTLDKIRSRTPSQEKALVQLWDVFRGLTTTEHARAVGITKAILLLTDGRIGPAFDSQVRAQLGVPSPTTSAEWIEILEGIADDIVAFEASHGALKKAVAPRFRAFENGRLYDMALGPGDRGVLYPRDMPSTPEMVSTPEMKTVEITVHTGRRRTLRDITPECERFVAGEGDGLLNVFVPHATCGLVVMELGSGSEEDLFEMLDRLLPRDDRWVHRHSSRGHGADHLVPALSPPSITIPVIAGRLTLGTWQSIALLDLNIDNPTRTVRLSFF